MQGRLCPDDNKVLQVFPEKSWREEVDEASRIGFSCFEYLWDKENVFEEIFSDSKNFNFIQNKLTNCGLIAKTVCADALCNFSLIDDREMFFEELQKILLFFRGTTVDIIVVPFFDDNLVVDHAGFECAVEALKQYMFDNPSVVSDYRFALEVDMQGDKLRTGLDANVDSQIGICLDVGNCSGSNFNIENEFVLLKNYIMHVHIKDKLKGGPNVPLGQGAVNFQVVDDVIKKIDYTGDLVFETAYEERPLQDAENNYHYLSEYYISV